MFIYLLPSAFSPFLIKRLIRGDHIVREVDKKLSKASFGSDVVLEDLREGSVPQWFGKALTEGFASPILDNNGIYQEKN